MRAATVDVRQATAGAGAAAATTAVSAAMGPTGSTAAMAVAAIGTPFGRLGLKRVKWKPEKRQPEPEA